MAASRKEPRPDDKGRVRVRFMDSTRFMEIEIDGSNETILEGIRQITTSVPGSRVLVRPVAPKGLAGAATSGSEDPLVEVAEEASETDMFQNDAQALEQAEQPPKRQRGVRPVPRPPEIPKDLDLDSPMALRMFIETMTTVGKDSSVSDRVLAIAIWLKEHRSGREIAGPELYTCCKVLRWPLPTDYASPLRNLKVNDKLASGTSRGAYTLTVVGEEHFREALAKE